jgi:hypothetical protein
MDLQWGELGAIDSSNVWIFHHVCCVVHATGWYLHFQPYPQRKNFRQPGLPSRTPTWLRVVFSLGRAIGGTISENRVDRQVY